MAKSVREQIAAQQAIITKATGLIEALKLKLGDEVDTAAIVAGAKVDFDYGKGTNVQRLTGIIAGVKLADPNVPKSAPQAKIAVGEGFDADVKVVYFTAIKKVHVEGEEAPTDAPAITE